MKLGILGAGKIVQEFLTVVDQVDNVELVSLYSTERSLQKNEKLANQYQIDKVYTDLEKNLNDPDIDTIYVALPNNLHYKYAKAALEAGKHVICEKPFTLTLRELETLEQIANEKNLILIEAITAQYLPNYQLVLDYLEKVGNIKLIECNFSQYSSRYDAFMAGEVPPVFDPKMGGGALVDLNVYNIHFVVGILGRPLNVHYYPNIERGVDTSGLLVLEYKDVKVSCMGAKDCHGLKQSVIQGDKGMLFIDGATGSLDRIELTLSGETNELESTQKLHRMATEFIAFSKMIEQHDLEEAKKRMEHSKLVIEVMENAIKDGGLLIG